MTAVFTSVVGCCTHTVFVSLGCNLCLFSEQNREIPEENCFSLSAERQWGFIAIARVWETDSCLSDLVTKNSTQLRNVYSICTWPHSKRSFFLLRMKNTLNVEGNKMIINFESKPHLYQNRYNRHDFIHSTSW